MEHRNFPLRDERSKFTELGDLLIDRYVEQQEAIQAGNRCRAIALEFEIKELRREKERIRHGMSGDP
jgi:hypothetical protein